MNAYSAEVSRTKIISSQLRGAVYFLGNLAFALTMLIGASASGATDVNPFYLTLLFALCTSPVLLLDRWNGRYLLLGILLFFFFLFFGMQDVIMVLFGGKGDSPDATAFSAAEMGILIGALCILLGYIAGARLAPTTRSDTPGADWSQFAVFELGMALWCVGSASIIYFSVYVVTEKTIAAAARGYAAMGPMLTFFVMLGHLVSPLGIVILAYGYARYRTKLWLITMLVVIVATFGVSFVTDIRGYAPVPAFMIIVALTLTDNKIPKLWVVGSAVALALVFPILTAYRVEVTGERGMTREQAAQNLDKVIEAVLAYRDKLSEGRRVAGKQTIFERASLKENVERAFEHTGVDREFQKGATLVAIPLAFIPRLIWPDKPDVPTGQLFNHEFYPGGVADTYISPSHLGELYWNFGWSGLTLGLTFIGFLLGFIAGKCSLAEHVSVTRLLILLVTIYYLCWGFEGAMSISYILWMRSMLFIGILHLLLARKGAAPAPLAATAATAAATVVTPAALPRYPNIMA